jgi:hypothetical protein
MNSLDRQFGLLTFLQIWLDLFLGVSLAFIFIHDGTRGRGEVDSLERGCWSGVGGFVIISRLR